MPVTDYKGMTAQGGSHGPHSQSFMELQMHCLSRRNALSLALTGVLSLGLTACGSGGGTQTTPPPSPGGSGLGFTPTVNTDNSLTATSAPSVSAVPAPAAINSIYGKHLSVVNAGQSLALGAKGAGVGIGVLDSGVRRNHPALGTRVLYNGFYLNDPPNNQGVDYVLEHGTAVSLTAAGSAFGNWPGGVAPEANIVSGRFLSDNPPTDDGSGQGNGITTADSRDFANFMNSANADLASRGARIINNSWGGVYFEDEPSGAAAMAEGFKDFIINRNGLVVFANGNNGDDVRYQADPSDTSSLPTLAPQAGIDRGWLTVAALDPDNPTQLLYFSQYCGRSMDYCLAAPGKVTIPGVSPEGAVAPKTDQSKFYVWQGTSFAAPMVSGAAAAVWSMFPYFTNDLVRQTILGTATDIGAPGVDPVFGHGLLDVGKAAQGPGKFDWGNVTVSFSGNSVWRNNITGTGGLVKQGAGTLSLTSTQSYTGDTRVEGGALDVRSGLGGSKLYVGSNGLVYGSGVFGRGVDNNGRFFNGRDVGASITGSYLHTSSANLGIWLGTPLQVNGTATLQGGQVSILGSRSGYTTSAKETLLNASGGVTGTFGSVKAAPNVFLDATLGYDANNVFLNINRIQINAAAAALGFTGASLDAAQRVESAFGLIDGGFVPPNSSFVGGAADLQNTSINAAIAERSLRSLAGQMHTANLALMLESMDAGRRAMTDRFDTLVDRPTMAGSWSQNLRDSGGLAQTGFSGMDYQMDGWTMGQDVRVGRNGVFGLAASHSEASGWMSELGDRTRNRQTQAQAYAGWLGEQAYLRGGIGAGQFDREVERNVQLGMRQEGVNTLSGGDYTFANIETGYRLAMGAFGLSPYAGSQYAHIRNDGFNEAGASGFGLRADSWSFDRWQAYTGLRLNRDWQMANGLKLGWDARAEWQRTLSDSNPLLASFTGIEQWSPVSGLSMARQSNLFGLGFNARWQNGSLLRLDVSHRQSELGDNSMANVSYRYRF